MASDYYLNINEPKIVGESKTVADALEITTFGWGAAQPGSAASGGGMNTGKVKMDDFTFTMPNNSASPHLMISCAKGTPHASAKLQVRKSGGDSPEPYLIVDFKELIIASYKTNGPGGDESNPQDEIAFNYSAIQIEYKEQDAKGKLTSKGVTKWSVKTGKSEF